MVQHASALFAQAPVKAVALLEGRNVVFTQFAHPASIDSMFFGFSMGKTVTAMAVGKAICAGKLSLSTKAAELIPALAGKALGEATVVDLLRMTSGTSEINKDSTILSSEQSAAWDRGDLDLMDVLVSDRVTQAKRGLFRSYKPGEAFSYKSTDPLLLGAMTSRATALPWTDWVQQAVLDPMGVSEPGLYSQDRFGTGLSESGLRLRFLDWIRFAVWVKRESQLPGCFGDFVRSAMTTQIPNGRGAPDRPFGKLFGGYGYFIWTENEISPSTAFASGWGGQRIGWSADPANDRIVVVFSSVESWMPALYQLTKEWLTLHKAAK